ncbi:alpha/beta hydrolase, partial [Streptomyces sp. HSW2009]|uniref:alpha/beta hydrolase n=1 Tax=Streptomyces sp. HSW2009 TaxID=3142890 RepID=UPI0032EE5CA7
LNVSTRDWLDTHQDATGVRTAAKNYLHEIAPPPENGSPKANATWWKSLTGDEQDAYVALNPAGLGKLDGIPSDIRDEANRTVLAEKQAEYRTELLGIPKEPKKYETRGPKATTYTDEWLDWKHTYMDRKEHLKASLKGMEAIEERFTRVGQKGTPRAYLLKFSPEGTGRAVIATGNPDTADHTAVFVPGTKANLSNIKGDMNRTIDLWKASSAQAPDHNISTITWLGYDAPQNVLLNSPDSGYANRGAADFNQFLEGLSAASHSGTGSHLTAIGHSYGSTLIGSTARQGDLRVDDVIFAGSPGAQVSSAEEMDVPKGHVWNEEADGDKIPDIGRPFHGGERDDPLLQSSFARIIPSDEIFGANQMATDGSGHTSYFNYDDERDIPSLSLLNQALVVVGRQDRVKMND